jgi:hypothetical protein
MEFVLADHRALARLEHKELVWWRGFRRASRDIN